MKGKFMKKIVFITGASRGIGAAIAEKFAKEGCHLAINSRNEALLKKKAQELEEKYHIICLACAGDIRNQEFVQKTFLEIEERLGTIDVLVNNAGISYIGLLTDMEIEDWYNILDTNLTSVFLCSKYVIPQMLQKKKGKIINISSVWGSAGASCEVAYSASKGGINMFTKALAKELAPSNIQVNAIACGIIDTEMNACFTEEERKELEEEVPMGRFGTPEEVAKMAWFMVNAPEYFTGQIVTVDGGWI